jgi:3-oxoacyl-[acyl-carrier protein] reductase
MSDRKLENDVAVVTGSGRGIGREIAIAFAKEGAKLAVTARTETEIKKVAEEIQAVGGNAIAVKMDVCKEEDVNNMVKKVIDVFGRIDILVNNAGVVGGIGPVVKCPIEEWDRIFAVDIRGPFLCSKAVLPGMIKQKRGKIINVTTASELTTLGYPRRAVYLAAKSALNNFTMSLAKEVREFNINVNAFAPGSVLTKLWDDLVSTNTDPDGEDMSARIEVMKSRGIFNSPNEASRLALYLASHESDMLSGQILDVAVQIVPPGSK